MADSIDAMQFAYLDDSGDSGLKFAEGSTRYIVMAACIFDSAEAVEKAWTCIDSARHLSFDGIHFQRFDREFKYNKTKDKLKTVFYEKLKPADYAVRAIILDKTTLYSSHLIQHPNDLKSYLIRQLFTHTFGNVKDAMLFIDGKDTRAFGMHDKQYLMGIVNSRCPGTLHDVQFVDSKENPMIQLADMTAGAIHAVHENPEGKASQYFDTFCQRTYQPQGTYWHFIPRQ